MIATLLIGISLGEPLLCILHCQVWLPLMLGQHAAMAHHHHMPGMDMSTMGMADMAGMSMSTMDMSTVDMAGMGISSMDVGSNDPAAPAMACHIRGTAGSDAPFHIPPSPVHELILAFMLTSVVLLLSHHLPEEMAAYPPNPFIAPPFQPPRPFAM